jgi:hypothetical protein
VSIREHKPRKPVHSDHKSVSIQNTKACPFRTQKRVHSEHESVSIRNTKACPFRTRKRVHSEHKSVSIQNTKACRPLERRTNHCCCRHQQQNWDPISLSSSRILRFSSHHSQTVGLHSPVAMENRSYPDFIWWARTQVYPDGVVGV